MEARPHRISDRQALAIPEDICVPDGDRPAWLVFLPWLLAHAVWAIPPFRHARCRLSSPPGPSRTIASALVAIGAGSLFISTVAGLMLYWAGARAWLGTAERAQKQGSVWASVWNPLGRSPARTGSSNGVAWWPSH